MVVSSLPEIYMTLTTQNIYLHSVWWTICVFYATCSTNRI